MRVGELVVCINDHWSKRPVEFPGLPMPVKGTVYTVSGMREKPKGVGLYLAEFDHILIRVRYPSGLAKKEPIIFNAKHFAHLNSPESISIETISQDNYASL